MASPGEWSSGPIQDPLRTAVQTCAGRRTPENKGIYRVLIQPRSEEDHNNIIEQGFTLVELLIVVVILGILAGIVVFAVGNLTDNAGANACKTEANTYATAFQAYKAQNNGSVPAGADTQARADTLKGDNLLTFEGSLRYLDDAQGGQATANPQWTADATGGITTSACA